MPSPFAWYLDITPISIPELYDYPIPGKRSIPLCEKHDRELEQKQVACTTVLDGS